MFWTASRLEQAPRVLPRHRQIFKLKVAMAARRSVFSFRKCINDRAQLWNYMWLFDYRIVQIWTQTRSQRTTNRWQARCVTCTSCTRPRRHVNSWLNLSRIQIRELCDILACVNISSRVDQKCPTLLQNENNRVQKAERTRRNLARGNFGTVPSSLRFIEYLSTYL